MSPEDLQTVRELFQKSPQLWADFRNLIDFLDLLTENPQAYKQLLQQLYKMITYIEGHCSSEDRIDYPFCCRRRFCGAKRPVFSAYNARNGQNVQHRIHSFFM